MANLDGTDDFFDSIDVIARIEEIEAIAVIERDEFEQEELDELYRFAECAEDLDDWEFGVTFISEYHFEDYAMDTLQHAGLLPRDLPSWIEIDTKATAANMRSDYTEYEFKGETYYAR